MHRENLALAWICTVLLLVFAFGCGGGDDPVEPMPVTLEGTSLAQTTATSFARVYVLGLPNPNAPGDYQARISVEGGADFTLFLQSDDTGPYFHAPLHPLTPNSGGSVVVHITDSTNDSPAQDLVVDALPEAPGAFGQFVDALRAHIEQRAIWAGSSFDDLAALDFSEVDPILFPLKVAQNYVDSDQPGSLTGLVDNAAGFLSVDERELLDRLLGYAPIDELVQAEIDTFSQEDPPALELRLSDSTPGSRRACIDIGPPLTTAAQLSAAMLTSALADVAINTDSAPGRTLDALGTVLLGGSTLPIVGKGFSALGSGVAAWETSADFLRSVLPNRLTHLTFDLDKSEFDEDEPGSGQWSNIHVIAASNGWDASKEIADIIISRLSPDLSLESKFLLGMVPYLEPLAMAGFNSALTDYIEQQGGVQLCPQTWDIDITDLPWSTGDVLDRKFSADPTFRRIRPLEVGVDTLRVAAQPSEFGGREVHADQPIQTRAIQVHVTPDDYSVEAPGDLVSITATIENAQDTSLRWDLQAGTWEDDLGNVTPGGVTRTIRTPLTPGFYPFLLTVESASNQGLRASGEPRRLDIATIRFGEDVGIQIEPQFACITPGETQQFTATVTGLEEYHVTWALVSGYGSIDQNGLYQSLAGGTSATVISAVVDEAPELMDEARVDAAACNCSLDIKVFGDVEWTGASAQAAYQVLDFDQRIYQFYFGFDLEGPPPISVSLIGTEEHPAPQPGDTGTWEVSFIVFVGDSGWVSPWENQTFPGVYLTITELTETYMLGTFSGSAVQLNGLGEVSSIVEVDVKMRAALWADDGWPCK